MKSHTDQFNSGRMIIDELTNRSVHLHRMIIDELTNRSVQIIKW
jgi:hypothetical protein